MEHEIKCLLIQVLRNQLTDLKAVEQYSIVQRDAARHQGYKLRIAQTEGLLNSVDPDRSVGDRLCGYVSDPPF
jgi:hypothetical protein